MTLSMNGNKIKISDWSMNSTQDTANQNFKNQICYKDDGTDPTNIKWNLSSSTSSTASVTFSNGSGTSADCNESLKHSHEQKAVFHGLKSAFRLVSNGEKGVDDPQVEEALHIAGRVGKAFLQTEDVDYDPDHSEEHLEDNYLSVYDTRTEIIEEVITTAWEKIEDGHHANGARLAVSVADHFDGNYKPV